MKVIILGAPGAGKGTQAKKISAKYGIPHISTGDIFRTNMRNGTELGIKAKEYIDHGMLVPDDIVVNLVLKRLQESDCANGYVLDGFPRTIPQAHALDRALAEQQDRLEYALDIELDDEIIIHRMSGRRVCLNCGASYHITRIPPKQEGICDVCGKELILREDDKQETVKKRLDIYHIQTQPLIDYYGEAGIIRAIDGAKDSDDIFQEIVNMFET